VCAGAADQAGYAGHDRDYRRVLRQSRFQQPKKMERFTTLLDENMDYAALYKALGLK
jgi:hypothetical protein